MPEERSDLDPRLPRGPFDEPPQPGATSELLLEEDPIRDLLARDLASNVAFAAGAAAIYWPLLLLWALLRRLVRRWRESRSEPGSR